LVSATIAYARDFSKDREQPSEISAPRDSLIEGETLEYSVEWLGIPIGIITLKVEGIESVNGHPCYHLSAKAMPNKFFRRFYDIEYNLHSYLDCKKLISRRFEKIKRIRTNLVYATAEFIPEKEEAKYTYYSPGGAIETIEFPSLKKSVVCDMQETVAIPGHSQDLLSGLYYFRLAKIDSNRECAMRITYERKAWELSMNVEKLFWKDIRKEGSFALIRVYPDSNLNDQVLGKRKVYAAFTADSRRIPVEFKLHSNAGFIRGIIKNLSEKQR
jgi:hypothetical protein